MDDNFGIRNDNRTDTNISSGANDSDFRERNFGPWNVTNGSRPFITDWNVTAPLETQLDDWDESATQENEVSSPPTESDTFAEMVPIFFYVFIGLSLCKCCISHNWCSKTCKAYARICRCVWNALTCSRFRSEGRTSSGTESGSAAQAETQISVDLPSIAGSVGSHEDASDRDAPPAYPGAPLHPPPYGSVAHIQPPSYEVACQRGHKRAEVFFIGADGTCLEGERIEATTERIGPVDAEHQERANGTTEIPGTIGDDQEQEVNEDDEGNAREELDAEAELQEEGEHDAEEQDRTSCQSAEYGSREEDEGDGDANQEEPYQGGEEQTRQKE